MGVLALLTGPSSLVTLGVLALVAAGAWRFVERRAGRGVVPLRSIRLTHQHALHVVELDGRRLVIGTGPGAAPRLLEAGAAPAHEEPWRPS